jgi:hypothetical protein
LGNHTSNSHGQQLTNHRTAKAKAADTTQNNEATPSQKHRKKQKKWATFTFSSLHIRKNHKTIQEHKHQNRLQMQQHICTAHQTSLEPQHPTPQQKRDLQLDIQNMHPLICGSD